MIYQKYLVISTLTGYASYNWKRDQVGGLKESRLTVRGDKTFDLGAFQEVWATPVLKSF